ncbi:MAG TPA: hypothetical protein VFS60_12180 [Thermoanaerobaculia bacterium]|nr:hypothetical protein [Thermoanaerobaculia bacterium]
MPRKSIVAIALAVLAPLALTGAARAQEGSLRFEKTVPFQRDHLVSLGAQVGPVCVSQVQFAIGGGGGGGIGDTIRARVHGGDSDTLTTITASFDSENPKDQEWVVTYTLELLDADGKLIDRFSRNESFEGEADVVKAERSILTYVVPMIAKVRIKLEAALD